MTSSVYSASSISQWYALSKRSEDSRIASFTKNNTTVKQANENFAAAADRLKSTDELFEAKNYKLLQYVLTAYGLESEIANVGKLKKVVNSDLTDENSLANRMSDTRFLRLAEALDFEAGGLANIQNASIQAGIKARYEKASYEIDLGTQNIALRQAQYFRDNISSATDIYSVLGDNTLRAVVQGVGQIPDQVAYQTVERQAEVFSRYIDLAKKGDTKYIDRLIQRFLANADAKNNADGKNDPQLQLLQSASSGGGLDLSQISGINLLI